MPGAAEVRYLVLADCAVPYLLAAVRWPDVAQAISAATPNWLEDPGLFDLPYDPSAVTLSFPQAASVAAGWSRQLHAEPAKGAVPYMRRMPANWSDLSSSERRAWGIEFVGRRRGGQARRVPRLRLFHAKIAAPSAAAQVNGRPSAPAGAEGGPGAGVDGPAVSSRGQVAALTSGIASVATERRRHMRVRVDGRVYIRYEHTTISAGLIDLSEGGVGCVLPGASPVPARGVMLDGPFLFEAEATKWRICLDVSGRINWHLSTRTGTHFGVAFGELANGETEGVQRILAAVCRKRGHR